MLDATEHLHYYYYYWPTHPELLVLNWSSVHASYRHCWLPLPRVLEPLVGPTTPPQEHYEEHYSRHYSEHYPDFLQHLRVYLAAAIIVDTATASGCVTRTSRWGPRFSRPGLFLATFPSPDVSPWKVIIGNKLKANILIKSRNQTGK